MGVMDVLKRLAGAYLVIVAVVVALFFIINPFLAESIDVPGVWAVVDILMVIGLALALILNCANKRDVSGLGPGEAITRRYFEANLTFYLTAGVTILFLHNWFSLLAFGADSLDGNHQAWIIWAAVDMMLPLVLGVTGCRLWRETSRS